MAQLTAPINQNIDIPDPLPKASTAAQLRETACWKYPFLDYSVLYALSHANIAQHESMEQADFLAACPIQHWRDFNKFLEKYDVRRYTDSVNSSISLPKRAWPISYEYILRARCALRSAMSDMDHQYLLLWLLEASRPMFLEFLADTHASKLVLRDLGWQYSTEKSVSLGRNFSFKSNDDVLSHLIKRNQESIINFLHVSTKFDIETKDKSGRTLLSHAIASGCVSLAKWLQ